MSHTHIATNFDWPALGSGATVIDLGGSHGELCIAVATRNPGLQFVVQELPRTLQSLDRSTVPDEVAPRIRFMEHDFFTPQPLKASVYVFRQILHNWSDSNVIKILRALIPSLENGARILVHDVILAEPGTTSLLQDRHARFVFRPRS